MLFYLCDLPSYYSCTLFICILASNLINHFIFVSVTALLWWRWQLYYWYFLIISAPLTRLLTLIYLFVHFCLEALWCETHVLNLYRHCCEWNKAEHAVVNDHFRAIDWGNDELSSTFSSSWTERLKEGIYDTVVFESLVGIDVREVYTWQEEQKMFLNENQSLLWVLWWIFLKCLRAVLELIISHSSKHQKYLVTSSVISVCFPIKSKILKR